MSYFADRHRGFFSLGITVFYGNNPWGRVWFVAIEIGPFSVGIEGGDG